MDATDLIGAVPAGDPPASASWPRIDRLSILLTVLTAALLAAAIAPLFAVEIPAMLDYTNHLARMYILTQANNPAYEAHWGVSTNIAMDVVVPAFARWMSVATAAKAFLGAGQVLVVTGAVFLEWVIKGRHRLGGPAALLALSSLPFAWGMVNFTFGMGLAVCGAALWIRLRSRSGFVRWTIHAAVVAALSITHLFDLGVYGLTIGLYELSRFERPPNLPSLARLALFMASPVLAVLGVMAFARTTAGPALILDWDLGLKLGWPAVLMNVYDTRLSIESGVALLALVAVLAATRRVSLTRSGLWIAAGFAAAYLAMPRELLGSQYQDVRLLTAAMLIVPAFTSTSLRSGPWRGVPLATVIAIIAANQFVTARAWLDYDKDIKEFQASFARLTRGSAVLIGQQDAAGREYQPVYYVATLAAPDVGVFVSSLYAQPGVQPLQPRPRYQALAVKAERDSYPPRLALLRAAMKPTGSLTAIPANIVNWPRRYQYLYVIGEGASNPLPGTLTQVAVGRRFQLFRIGPAG
jgi:hypothetical protein